MMRSRKNAHSQLSLPGIASREPMEEIKWKRAFHLSERKRIILCKVFYSRLTKLLTQNRYLLTKIRKYNIRPSGCKYIRMVTKTGH